MHRAISQFYFVFLAWCSMQPRYLRPRPGAIGDTDTVRLRRRLLFNTDIPLCGLTHNGSVYICWDTSQRERLPPSLSLIIGHLIFMGLGAMTLQLAVTNLVKTNSCIVASLSFSFLHFSLDAYYRALPTRTTWRYTNTSTR